MEWQVGNVFRHVCAWLSVHGVYHVTITHDALDLTVQKHAVKGSTCTLLVTSLRTCSNLFFMKHRRLTSRRYASLWNPLKFYFVTVKLWHMADFPRNYNGLCRSSMLYPRVKIDVSRLSGKSVTSLNLWITVYEQIRRTSSYFAGTVSKIRFHSNFLMFI